MSLTAVGIDRSPKIASRYTSLVAALFLSGSPAMAGHFYRADEQVSVFISTAATPIQRANAEESLRFYADVSAIPALIRHVQDPAPAGPACERLLYTILDNGYFEKSPRRMKMPNRDALWPGVQINDLARWWELHALQELPELRKEVAAGIDRFDQQTGQAPQRIRLDHISSPDGWKTVRSPWLTFSIPGPMKLISDRWGVMYDGDGIRVTIASQSRHRPEPAGNTQTISIVLRGPQGKPVTFRIEFSDSHQRAIADKIVRSILAVRVN